MIPIAAGIGIAIFIILFVFAVIKGTKDFDAMRTALLDDFAGKYGFESGDARQFNLREKIRDFSAIGVAENSIAHGAWKDDDHGRYFVFDQVRVTKGGSATRGGLFTICLAETNAPLGPDTIILTARNRVEAGLSRSMAGGRLGLTPVSFGDKDFDNRFVVFTAAPDLTMRLFDNGFRDFLKSQTGKISMPLEIEIKGKKVAAHNTVDQPRSMKKTEEIHSLYVLAKGVLNALCT